MRTKFPTAFIIVRSWLKYVFNCVGIIIFVFVPNRMVSVTDILCCQSSFLLILSFVEFLYMRWRFLDISVALNESLHSNLFVLDVVIPFLVLALYIFFIFSFTLSLFTFNLFYTHIFADSSPSLQLTRVESANSCPLYLHGVVREFLPIFTCVIVACIFHFYLGCVHPNIYPLCHIYLSFILHIWECVEYICVYFLLRGYPIEYIFIL